MTKSFPCKIVLQTESDKWVIPSNCRFLKMLIEEQSITPNQLLFDSSTNCQCFIKQLFLMAVIDEQQTQKPSSLAQFARQLVYSEKA